MPKDRAEKLKKYIKEDRPSKFKSYARKHCIDIGDLQLKKRRTLLHYCCHRGNDLIFRYLMKKGVDVLIQDSKGDTALHLALKHALHAGSKTVYTSIILPLIERDPSLLEVANNSGITCRRLLDRLVELQQDQDAECPPPVHDYCNDQSWEDKLAEEFRHETDDFAGRYADSTYDTEYNAETYDDWADRLRREYHMKHKYGSHSNQSASSKPRKSEDSKENLEEIRRKMREKYEENMKKDKENRAILKSKKYKGDMIKLLSGSNEIKYKDVPWPFTDNVSEVKTVMFNGVTNDKETYKKCLRDEQIRWHPDKFEQKLGKRLFEGDRNKIMERVKEISQELNKLSDLQTT